MKWSKTIKMPDMNRVQKPEAAISTSQVLDIANSVLVEPALLLDLQADTLRLRSSDALLAGIRQGVASRADQYPGTLDQGPQIARMVIAITVRLQAWSQLDDEEWMQHLWSLALNDPKALEAMGCYFSKAPLIRNEQTDQIGFDLNDARFALQSQ